MGKALVIDGLNVKNPLCVVNIETNPLDKALKSYYAVNNSINSSEKNALNSFVQGLIDAGIWDKIVLFYPMLGDNVDDLILETHGENHLLADTKSDFSVASRNLYANVGRSGNLSYIPDCINNLDMSKLGIVCSGKAESHNKYLRLPLYIDADNAIASYIQYDTYAYPAIQSGSSIVPIQGTEEGQSGILQNYLERIIACNVRNNIVKLYKDNELYSSNTYIPVGNISRIFRVLANIKDSVSAEEQPYQYNFFSLTQDMTENDWVQYYSLLLTFLKSVGKHSV